MTSRFIGSDRRDAVGWLQDLLATTRPLAEAVLSESWAARKLVETSSGFMLLEDDEDVQARHSNVLHQSNRPFKGWSKVKPRMKPNPMRLNGEKMPTHMVAKQAASKYSPHATDMIEAHRMRMQNATDHDSEED